MAELVYAFDLKSNGEIRAGSIPAPSTKETKKKLKLALVFLRRRRCLAGEASVAPR